MLSTIDLQSGYHQVILDDDAKENSAFCMHLGLFQWRVMSFGLTNAPATFERMMEAIVGHMHWKQILVYLDDIIVFASDFETHMERLTEVLRRLRDAGLKINPKKCQFFRESVLYLGHVVSESPFWGPPRIIADSYLAMLTSRNLCTSSLRKTKLLTGPHSVRQHLIS